MAVQLAVRRFLASRQQLRTRAAVLLQSCVRRFRVEWLRDVGLLMPEWKRQALDARPFVYSADGHLLIALSVDDDGVVHAAPEPRWPSVDEERAAMRYMNTPDGMQLEPLASLAARRVLFGAGVRQRSQAVAEADEHREMVDRVRRNTEHIAKSVDARRMMEETASPDELSAAERIRSARRRANEQRNATESEAPAETTTEAVDREDERRSVSTITENQLPPPPLDGPTEVSRSVQTRSPTPGRS